MTISELILPELQQEVALTEKFLKRIPTDKLDFKPHEKSMTVQQLMSHLAEIPDWITGTLAADGMDMSSYTPPIEDSPEAAVSKLNANWAKAKALVEAADDAEYQKTWAMKNGEHIIFEMPKYQCLRGMGLNQFPHHRAQLGVYLRLMGESVPATYGPSADEQS